MLIFEGFPCALSIFSRNMCNWSLLSIIPTFRIFKRQILSFSKQRRYVDLLSIIYTIYYLYVVIVSWADQRTEWWRSPWPRTPGRAASSALSRGKCFGRESGRRGDPASCLSRWQPWGNTKLQTNAYTHLWLSQLTLKVQTICICIACGADQTYLGYKEVGEYGDK